MNTAVIEVAEQFADRHGLSLRDVFARMKRAGVEFRTETNWTYDGSAKVEQAVFLGFAHEGFFYPFNDENHKLLETLMLHAYDRGPRKHPREASTTSSATKEEAPGDREPDGAPEREVVPTAL